MTVRELIARLEEIEDKDRIVTVYCEETECAQDLHLIALQSVERYEVMGVTQTYIDREFGGSDMVDIVLFL